MTSLFRKFRWWRRKEDELREVCVLSAIGLAIGVPAALGYAVSRTRWIAVTSSLNSARSSPRCRRPAFVSV